MLNHFESWHFTWLTWTSRIQLARDDICYHVDGRSLVVALTNEKKTPSISYSEGENMLNFVKIVSTQNVKARREITRFHREGFTPIAYHPFPSYSFFCRQTSPKIVVMHIAGVSCWWHPSVMGTTHWLHLFFLKPHEARARCLRLTSWLTLYTAKKNYKKKTAQKISSLLHYHSLFVPCLRLKFGWFLFWVANPQENDVTQELRTGTSIWVTFNIST